MLPSLLCCCRCWYLLNVSLFLACLLLFVRPIDDGSEMIGRAAHYGWLSFLVGSFVVPAGTIRSSVMVDGSRLMLFMFAGIFSLVFVLAGNFCRRLSHVCLAGNVTYGYRVRRRFLVLFGSSSTGF